MVLAILGLRSIHDLERLGHGPAVLIRRALHVLVGDVRLTHLEMGVHASARQAHSGVLLGLSSAFGRYARRPKPGGEFSLVWVSSTRHQPVDRTTPSDPFWRNPGSRRPG